MLMKLTPSDRKYVCFSLLWKWPLNVSKALFLCDRKKRHKHYFQSRFESGQKLTAKLY